MLPRNDPDRIQITFDDHRLVANAGLILPATLALHLGLPQLVQQRLDLGNAPGSGEHGRQDCDPDGIRAGWRRLHRRRRRVAHTAGRPALSAAWSRRHPPWVPSGLGTFLRSFRWGQVRQLDRVSRELLARAWAAGAGPGDVLMSRLREGRANTARGAAHFLRETVGRVRYGGARGQLTVRADSGFYAHALVAVCPRNGGPLLHHHPPAPEPAESH